MTTKSEILKAIRAKCLDCSCYQPNEVRICHLTKCVLHPFRMGSDPAPARTRGPIVSIPAANTAASGGIEGTVAPGGYHPAPAAHSEPEVPASGGVLK